jgi:hypothetical protein
MFSSCGWLGNFGHFAKDAEIATTKNANPFFLDEGDFLGRGSY